MTEMIQQKHRAGINRAEVGDAWAIAEVHVLSWRAAYKGLVPEDVLNNLSIDDRARRWSETLSDPSHGVLKQIVDGRVIGFSHATRSKDEDAKEDTADVYAIYLAPNYIGKGHGRELMRQTLVLLKEKGFSTATLWVMDSNRAAIAFYESQRFVDDNLTKPYKIGGEHSVTIKRFRIDLN